MSWFVAIGAVFVFGILGVQYAARRYERQRIAEEAWTSRGPKRPTVLVEGPNARSVGWARNAFYKFQFGRLPVAREDLESDEGDAPPPNDR